MDDLDRILHRILDPLFEHRPGRHRWMFAVLAIVLIAFTFERGITERGVSFDVASLAGVVIYMAVLLLLILQFAYPTLMGWLLVFGPIAMYSFYLLGSFAVEVYQRQDSEQGSVKLNGDLWLALAITILLPVMIFVFGRPGKR